MVMAVNLSATQFRRFDLTNTVIEALVLSELTRTIWSSNWIVSPFCFRIPKAC